ncbi:uncharacterized protein DDB_G0283697-like [Aphis gossypii]|uniref:uncharacterized protein DDB_G0283697-like n=1 Tax=Aphis gossypii TaxID=80765 RepID=UPI002159238C|nr:uncharacterized protein DDB_G0283697-like [Aphis gossypii]
MDTPSAATREYNENEQNSDIPEHDENPEHNEYYEHEPETPTNGVAAKPSDIDEQDEINSQPKRRHRRRRDPNTGLEVSEEYDTHEEQDEETPLEDNKIDTPEYDETSEDHHLYEHEPEIPTNEVTAKPSDIGEQDEKNNQPKRRHRRRRNPNTGLEVSEEYDTHEEQDEETPLEDNKIDTPEYDETSEDHHLYEHEPETPTNGVAAKPSDIDEQHEINSQPRRSHRRRRYPNTGLEVSEEYDTHEEQDEETPLEDNKIDTPEYDETSEDHNLYEHEPEIPTNGVAAKPSDIGEQDERNNQPKRRHRRRRNPNTGLEVSEEYDTYEEQDEETPLEDNKIDTPEYDETSEHNELNDVDNNNQPEVSEYPELSALSSKDSSTPTEADENGNIVRPNPRKIRHRRKSKKPQSFNGIDRTPIEVNNEDINNNPVEDQDVNNHDIPYNDDDVLEEDPHHGYGERIDENQPELSEYPELSALSSKDSSTPTEADENGNIVRPNPRKIRRRRKSKKPQSFNGIDRTPIVVNNEDINNNPVDGQDVNNNDIPYNNDDVLEEDPHNGYGERIDENQPELSEYPKNSDLLSEDSTTPTDTDDNGSVVRPNRRKIRRRRKSKKPQSFNEINRTPIEVNNKDINNNPVEGHDVNNNAIPYKNDDVLEEDPHNGYGERIDENQPDLSEYPKNSDLLSEDSTTPTDTDDNGSVVRPNPRKIRRRRKSKKPQSFNGNDKTPIETNDVSTKTNPTNIDAENSRVPNEEKSTETPEIDPNNIQKNPNKKRRIRRIIRTYVVNKATNERIPIIDQTYSTTDGFPDDINNKLESLESDDSNVNDSDANTDNDDYSSFLFKEYNSDQCKRDAYDRFKKVTSQDAKQIAYRSVLDTSEMRSNMLATLKNAISNVKASRTFNDVDQSLRTVSYSLKVGLKQTVSDLVIKVIPLAKDFLKTAENLKELYQRGPQSTHKMLTNILENESTVPESAKDILRLISPQFDVDELINNIFEKPCTAKSLKEKKIKAQRKLIDLSKNMDTAISNIDCFVLSAMSTVGIGADTLKLLKSGKVIMSDKHPRAKILRDAVGIIKAGKKIRNNDDSFTPTLTPSDGTTKSDEDDDDEDPDEVAQKNEEFLKTVPDLDDNIPIPKKVPNKRQPLGVIVVHPDKQIEYKEVTDTSQLKKFVGDQTKKYKLQSKNKHPKFLKLNSKRLIDAMVADVKKKAERNGMTKKKW